MKITEVHAIILRQPEADPFDQAGAEIPLHPLLGGWQGGVVFGGLELPAMLGVIAPPALGDDGLPGLQVGAPSRKSGTGTRRTSPGRF